MLLRKLAVLGCAIFALVVGQQAVAQDELTCADIEWGSTVTDQYPSIADACDDVVVKNDKMFARVKVVVQRVRGNNLTFRINNYRPTICPILLTRFHNGFHWEIGLGEMGEVCRA